MSGAGTDYLDGSERPEATPGGGPLLVGPTFVARSSWACGTNLYRWADGGEATAYVDHRAQVERTRVRSRGVRGQGGVRSRREAVRRAKARIRRAARHGGYCYMVTLTFPGNGVHFLEDAKRQLAGWLHGRAHGRRGEDGKRFFKGAYLAIPERHRSHGWHWHVLTPVRPPAGLLQASWSLYLGSERAVRVHHKHFEGRSAAAYASKYVAKAMEPGSLGRHRYLVGDAVVQPEPEYRLVFGADVHEAIWQVLPVEADGLARVVSVDTGAGPPAAWAGW